VTARTACDFASPDRAGFHWPVLDLADDRAFGYEATAINKLVGTDAIARYARKGHIATEFCRLAPGSFEPIGGTPCPRQ
jgi:hypothetical protein